MSADEERGKALAESARQLVLWLRDNELPSVPGLKGATLDQFLLFAGIYSRIGRTRGLGGIPHFLSQWMGAADPKANKRLSSLNLDITHGLYVTDENEIFVSGKGWLNRNRIFLKDKMSIEQRGALYVLEPTLDSVSFEDRDLVDAVMLTFAAILRRTDAVWDDAEAAAAAQFRYRSIFDFETPRVNYQRNVRQIVPPDELKIKLPQNRADEELARRVKEFREYLYFFATYDNRERNAEDGGDHYNKWIADTPLAKKDRQFHPALLSETFLKECFTEHKMKKGEDFLYLQAPGAAYVYWLRPEQIWPKKRPFSVQPLLRLDSGSPVPKDAKISFPVRAVVFHALEGADHLPNDVRRGKLELRSVKPIRFTYNYKAALRDYFNDPKLDLGSDERWREVFVDIYFADATYEIQVDPSSTNRKELFLNSLEAEAANATGDLKTRLEQMIALYKSKPNLGLVIKGMELEGRVLIGVSGFHVYEFWPGTGLITRAELNDWVRDLYVSDFSSQAYRNTAGMLPFIALITWGGVIIASGGVLGLGATLGNLARMGVREVAAQAVKRGLTKEAIKKFRSQLTAVLADGLLALMPKTDTLPFEFMRGLLHGFGGGTISHYLSEADERLSRAAEVYYKAALNKLTKGAYRAHAIYQKVSAAVHKLTGLYKALSAVWTDERARKAAEAFNKIGRHVGMAFLIILFVFVYVDYVYRSRHKTKNELDEWAKKQRDAFVWTVKNTGNDIADYARDLRKELLDTVKPPDPVVVRQRNEKLSGKLAGAARSGIAAVPAIAEVLQTLLAELGIDSWDELKSRGLLELLSDGFEVVLQKHPGLKPEEARAIGEAIGELIGAIALGRKIVPAHLRKNVGMFRGEPHEKALKKALDDGTLRGLWRLAMTPLKALREALPGVVRGLRDTADEHQGKFDQTMKKETSYRDFLRDLVEDNKNLLKILADLAIDDTLEAKIRELVMRVQTEKPPDIATLLKTDDPLWPRNAVLFVLTVWLHFGLREVLEVFALVEDSAPYDGHFRIAQIFELLGLDVALDDKTVAQLKSVISLGANKATSP